MDWIVFGDDWGAHPSTAQHLALNFPKEDRVIWIDSIGMRQPSFSVADIHRFTSKAMRMFKKSGSEDSIYNGTLGGLVVVRPKVIPWHLIKAATYLNTRSLALSIGRAMKILGVTNPVLLSSTPVVTLYLDKLPHDKIVYLRQDEYESYPGCDPILVKKTEPVMFDLADVIFVTARSLFPAGDASKKTHYLPHGVQFNHFAQVSLNPSGKKILGFFGTIDERMDFDLVREVAESATDWQLEFIGDVLYKPPWLDTIPNIYIRPVVSFGKLPSCLSGWTAAWIPYVQSHVTKGINPLKIREYLAAGLATHCTPLPEIRHMNEIDMVSDQASQIVGWMNSVLTTDSEDARITRRKSVEHQDWSCKSREFRKIIQKTFSAGMEASRQ